MFKRIAILLLAFVFSYSQKTTVLGGKKKLSALERRLLRKEMSLVKEFKNIFLDSLTYRKFQRHQLFYKKIHSFLESPETYSYAFDSLGKYIYNLAPEDSAFRIYTWFLTDSLGNHYHFGIVQRKIYTDKKKKNYKIKLYDLQDKVDRYANVEREPLDNTKWLGALYYKPRNSEYGVLTYKGKYLKVNPVNGKRKKAKITYYVLLGWNGHDRWTNYKIIETLVFDDKNDKIIFGAPIFYYGNVPKYRVVFKYTDNSPFNLNYGYIVVPKGKKQKKIKKYPAIIFDHLSKPNKANRTDHWMIGADGSYDALVYAPKRWKELRKGVFLYVPDVTVWTPEINQYDPEEIIKLAEEERAKMLEQGINVYK